MKIGISQPTFLPWQGYFALINYVDEFIFLDDVQFEKRSWQQRNKIKYIGNELLLTVPVITKNKHNQKINEVLIDQNSNYIDKHLKTIKLAYSKTKYFDLYFPKILNIYNKDFEKLIDLNKNLIDFFLIELNITKKFSFSSDLKLSENKHFLIDKICKIKKCTTYISTKGSQDYLNLIDNKDINYKIEYFSFKNQLYQQTTGSFIKFLSIIDLLFNEGENSKSYLEKNFFID
jgi:hypothetical protein